MVTVPASSRRWATPSVTSARLPRSSTLPASKGSPAMRVRSLIGRGTPSRGRRAASSSKVPARRAAVISAWAASA